MLSYETRDGRGEIEHSVFSGGISTVGGRPVRGATQRKAEGILSGYIAPALEGIAATYGTPFDLKDGVVGIFEVGAFADAVASRSTVKFQLDHEDDFVVSDTTDRLELHSDDKALGFRLRLVDDGLAEIVVGRKSDAISVAFSADAKDVRMFDIDGVPVKLIKRAKLTEISLLHRGRIRQAFARLVDTAKCGPLASEMKSAGFGVDGAYCHLMRTIEDAYK